MVYYNFFSFMDYKRRDIVSFFSKGYCQLSSLSYCHIFCHLSLQSKTLECIKMMNYTSNWPNGTSSISIHFLQFLFFKYTHIAVVNKCITTMLALLVLDLVPNLAILFLYACISCWFCLCASSIGVRDFGLEKYRGM